MPILRVQNQDGTWSEIPAIVGPPGPQGERGEAGPAGDPGKTPEKGVDYFTEADKTEMVQAVLAALPNAEEANF